MSKKQRDAFDKFMKILLCVPRPKTHLTVFRGDRERRKVDRRDHFPFYASFDLNVAVGYRGHGLNSINPIRKIVILQGTAVGYHHYLKQVIFPGGSMTLCDSSYVDSETGVRMIRTEYHA